MKNCIFVQSSEVSPARLSRYAQNELASVEFANSSFSKNIQEKILRYGAPMGSVIEHHQRLGRCMDRLRELIAAAEKKNTSLASGTVVVADELCESSGRFNRFWHAPKGGLWLAMAWADTLLPEFSRLLPFAAGISCCETIREYGVDAAIKWVNDVHVGGRKLAGILSETTIGSTGERYLLIGIGINVNNESFPEEFRNSATGISVLTGRKIDLHKLCIRLLARLTWNLGLVHFEEERYLECSGSGEGEMPDSLLLTTLRRLSDSVGRQVVYGYDVRKKPLYQATVLDIDREGGLVMQLRDGTMITECSGEILYT